MFILYGFKVLSFFIETPRGFLMLPLKIDNKSDSNADDVGPGPAPSPCKIL